MATDAGYAFGVDPPPSYTPPYEVEISLTEVGGIDPSLLPKEYPKVYKTAY